MIDINEVEKIHDILIEKFGGGKGIRDKGLLESAINRPFQTFDGQDLYPDPVSLHYIPPNTGIRIKKRRFISGFVGLTDAAL